MIRKEIKYWIHSTSRRTNFKRKLIKSIACFFILSCVSLSTYAGYPYKQALLYPGFFTATNVSDAADSTGKPDKVQRIMKLTLHSGLYSYAPTKINGFWYKLDVIDNSDDTNNKSYNFLPLAGFHVNYNKFDEPYQINANNFESYIKLKKEERYKLKLQQCYLETKTGKPHCDVIKEKDPKPSAKVSNTKVNKIIITNLDNSIDNNGTFASAIKVTLEDNNGNIIDVSNNVYKHLTFYYTDQPNKDSRINLITNDLSNNSRLAVVAGTIAASAKNSTVPKYGSMTNYSDQTAGKIFYVYSKNSSSIGTGADNTMINLLVAYNGDASNNILSGKVNLSKLTNTNKNLNLDGKIGQLHPRTITLFQPMGICNKLSNPLNKVYPDYAIIKASLPNQSTQPVVYYLNVERSFAYGTLNMQSHGLTFSDLSTGYILSSCADSYCTEQNPYIYNYLNVDNVKILGDDIFSRTNDDQRLPNYLTIFNNCGDYTSVPNASGEDTFQRHWMNGDIDSFVEVKNHLKQAMRVIPNYGARNVTTAGPLEHTGVLVYPGSSQYIYYQRSERPNGEMLFDVSRAKKQKASGIGISTHNQLDYTIDTEIVRHNLEAHLTMESIWSDHDYARISISEKKS